MTIHIFWNSCWPLHLLNRTEPNWAVAQWMLSRWLLKTNKKYAVSIPEPQTVEKNDEGHNNAQLLRMIPFKWHDRAKDGIFAEFCRLCWICVFLIRYIYVM